MTRHITTALLAVALSSSSAISVAATAATTEPTPFGLDCAPITDGVRHCSNDGEGQRVASFDGVPIDVDVTLPPEGDGPWPTIVMIHGLGGDKGMYQRNVEMVPGEPAATPPNTTRQDNVWFASRGYAVVTPSYRAFGRSCGHGPLGLGAPGGAKLQTGPCADGFWRYQDARYEVRDVQHLLGLLADEGIAVPTRNGAMGMSSGGQIAIMVGALNDRVMCDGVDRGDLCDGHGNGDLVPWTSPDGTPMAMGAISSIWAATDLIGSVLVNGRFLDFDDDTIDQILAPRGILLQSYMDATLVVAEARGYVATTGTVDLAQDVEAAVAAWNAGEPYPPFMDDALDELARFHSPLAIKGDPAPMLLQNGWSDDFFPIRESLRLYNDLHRRFEHPDVVLLAGDYGHSRAANRDGAAVAFNDIATAFFDSRLKGEGEGPAAGSVTVYESTCPAKGDDPAVERGPFMAPSWDALATGRLLFGNDGPQSVINPGGDPNLGLQFDPLGALNPLGTEDPCKSVPPPTWIPGTVAFAEHEVAETFTMVGRPTIRATIETFGVQGQLNGRLWDVDADGNHRLVTRGVYRLEDNQVGELVFQLNGNASTFEAGHTILLELAPSDAPTFRATTLPFTVQVENLSIELPVLEDSATVGEAPAPAANPAEDSLPATGAGLVLAGLLVLAAAGAVRRGRT